MIENINYTSSGIPKIIHQVWINDTFLGNPKRDVPQEWIKSIELWKEIHPDWTHILWTDDMALTYLNKFHPDVIDHYKNYEYLIQRADMIRYFILYDYGGVYCDLDLYPSKNIDDYIIGPYDHFVYSAGSDVTTNAFMISPKGSNIMRELCSKLKKDVPWFCVGKHLKVMYSTGPNFLYNVLLNTKNPYIILSRKLFYPYSSSEDKMINETTQDIVISPIKNTSGSWHSIDSIIYTFINKNKEIFITIGILSVLLVIIGLIYYIFKYRECKESKDKCEQECKI
jgi:mannosyltransferase OCH1-like enzyme